MKQAIIKTQWLITDVIYFGSKNIGQNIQSIRKQFTRNPKEPFPSESNGEQRKRKGIYKIHKVSSSSSEHRCLMNTI